MEATKTKKWYKSKTMWAGVVGVIVVAYNAAIPQFLNTEGVQFLPAIPEFIYGILSAFGLYARKVATAKIA